MCSPNKKKPGRNTKTEAIHTNNTCLTDKASKNCRPLKFSNVS